MVEGPRLTAEQVAEVKGEMAPGGAPVRFLFRGRCLNIQTGSLQSKGCNVIYQRHYWLFSRKTAIKVATFLGDGVRAEFSN